MTKPVAARSAEGGAEYPHHGGVADWQRDVAPQPAAVLRVKLGSHYWSTRQISEEIVLHDGFDGSTCVRTVRMLLAEGADACAGDGTHHSAVQRRGR